MTYYDTPYGAQPTSAQIIAALKAKGAFGAMLPTVQPASLGPDQIVPPVPSPTPQPTPAPVPIGGITDEGGKPAGTYIDPSQFGGGGDGVGPGPQVLPPAPAPPPPPSPPVPPAPVPVTPGPNEGGNPAGTYIDPNQFGGGGGVGPGPQQLPPPGGLGGTPGWLQKGSLGEMVNAGLLNSSAQLPGLLNRTPIPGQFGASPFYGNIPWGMSAFDINKLMDAQLRAALGQKPTPWLPPGVKPPGGVKPPPNPLDVPPGPGD